MFGRPSLRAIAPVRSFQRHIARRNQRQQPTRCFSTAKDETAGLRDRIVDAKDEEPDTTRPQDAASHMNDDGLAETKSDPSSQDASFASASKSDGTEAYSRSRRQRAEQTSQQMDALRRQQRSDTGQEAGQSKSGKSSGSIEKSKALDGASLSPNTFQGDLAQMEQFDRDDISAVVFDPAEVSREDLLHSGRGSATITAGNFEGVVQDRIKMLTDTTQDGTRWAPEMAKRMMRGGLVSFKSEEEKAAVVEAAKDYAYRLRRSASNVRKGLPDVVAEHEFAPLPARMQTSIVDRYVRGRHTDVKAKPHGSEVLNHVRASLARNNTYLGRDGAVFLRRVEGLLAGSRAATKPKKQVATAKK